MDWATAVDTVLSGGAIAAGAIALARGVAGYVRRRGQATFVRSVAVLPPGSRVEERHVDGSSWSVCMDPTEFTHEVHPRRRPGLRRADASRSAD